MEKPEQPGATMHVPSNPSLNRLRAAASSCKGCDLWKNATQTVFGEGATTARIVFVGEQPGDREDQQGRPFVGPAGRILSSAMEAAGISRTEVYVTNIVKHFKWEPRGKRRIHKKPNHEEITACRPWFEAEVAALRPEVIVCLGATASQAILGRQFKVSTSHGKWVESTLAPFVTATVHPSSLLRMPDEESRREGMQSFVKDLRRVRMLLDKLPGNKPRRAAS
jgi:uracil-DNA glycosylase